MADLTPEEVSLAAAAADLANERGLTFVNNGMLRNIHPTTACAGRHCWVHNPSTHRLDQAPISWRSDKLVAERICPHGVGHPDPDDVGYQESIGRTGLDIHGCDGCCGPTGDPDSQ